MRIQEPTALGTLSGAREKASHPFELTARQTPGWERPRNLVPKGKGERERGFQSLLEKLEREG